MINLQRICFITGLAIFLSGCNQKNTSETIIPPKKPVVIKQAQKKHTSYKYCTKHTKVMTFASKYIVEEFDKGYFLNKDILGAKAQLFLIESKSPTIFAKNINKALKSYNLQYQLAKKNKCNLKSFKISPITKVKNTIETLEKSDEKKDNK